MGGAPARAIQEVAGHRNLSTTERYMHLSPAAVDAAIRLLEDPAPGSRFGDMLETGDSDEPKCSSCNSYVVPSEGLEPSLPCGHRILIPERIQQRRITRSP